MWMTSATMRMVNGVHRHATHYGKALRFTPVNMMFLTRFRQRLFFMPTTSYNTYARPAFWIPCFEAARG
jgi:cytochrome c oxidase assembly factor CtaG